MGLYHERLQRDFQVINIPENMQKIAEKYLKGSTFFIKGLYNLTPLIITDIQDSQKIIFESEYELDDSAVFYKMNGKYMLVSSVITERRDKKTYAAIIKEIKISQKERDYPRIPIERDKVYITNVRATKQVISSLLFNVPTSVKVYFKQYEHNIKQKADDVHIEVFDKKTEKLELIRKSGKMLYISDTSDPFTYMSDEPEKFIDYRSEMEEDITKVIHEYKSKKIISELIVPINYIGHDGKEMSIGYIQLTNKKEPIPLETADEIKKMAIGMIDQIREANAVFVHTRQTVRNISQNGLQLLITDASLKKNLIQQKGFSFDIVFGVSPPISVFSEIAYFGTNPANDVVIGVHITGFAAGEKEAQRYSDFIEAMMPKRQMRR